MRAAIQLVIIVSHVAKIEAKFPPSNELVQKCFGSLTCPPPSAAAARGAYELNEPATIFLVL